MCFPSRACASETPVGASLINRTPALTPSSPAIAAACFTAIGASLVLMALGLKLQWRRFGVRPWLVMLATAPFLAGVIAAWTIGGRLAAISAIDSGTGGRPSAPTPSSLTGSWPLVLSAGYAMVVFGAVALFLILTTAALRERRRDRFESCSSTRSEPAGAHLR